MYASESAKDMTALGDGRRQGSSTSAATRPVKVLPVTQLAPPVAPLIQRESFEGGGQLRTCLESFLPSLRWMKAYRWRDSLKADAIAGITVGTMLIPQVCEDRI